MKELVKIVTFVPETHADEVREALGAAGAGKIGNYSYCRFSTKGIGRFKPEEGADPAIGEIGKMEQVKEERIEVACDKAMVTDIIKALKEAHPYEEVVVDIYPMLVLED